MNALSNQKKIITLLSINYNKSKKQFLYEKDRLHQVREDNLKRIWICECIKNRADIRDYQIIVTHQEEVNVRDKNFGDNFSFILFYYEFYLYCI